MYFNIKKLRCLLRWIFEINKFFAIEFIYRNCFVLLFIILYGSKHIRFLN